MDAIERLAREIERLPRDVEEKAERLVRSATLRVEALGKQFVPVRTGLLRSSIDSDFDMGGSKKTGETGTTVNYAHFVEHGTRRMAPRRYLGRAADIVEPQFYAGAKGIADGILGARVIRG